MLFAALEAKGSASEFQWNTVAIAGLDGYARAKATFTPMSTPYVGCAGAVLPAGAHVAAGKVYFADGKGVIRSLDPHGHVAVIATIPFSGQQQMLSFAVSPDGSRLLASVFSIPPKAASGDPCQGAPAFGPGDFTFDMYSAAAGSAPVLLYHRVLSTSSSQPYPSVMALTGWDQVGVEALDPATWATQGGGPNPGGVFVRVDPTTGKMTGLLDNYQTCLVWSIAASGNYACITSSGDVSVRRADHTEIWGSKGFAPNAGFYFALLSPKEGRVATAGSSGYKVVTWAGGNIAWNGNAVTGWVTDTTVITGGYSQNFGYVTVGPASASAQVDIGFKGLFVGAVAS